MGLFDWMHDLFSTKTEEAGNSFFTVETSEGELVTINTSDSSSPFYGSSWTKILKAYEAKVCVSGHLHAESLRWAFNGWQDHTRHLCVSGDGIFFKPCKIL